MIDATTIEAQASALWADAPRRTRRAGRTWYDTAIRDVRELSAAAPAGVGPVAAAAILAVLSPRTRWHHNWLWARQQVEAALAGASEPPLGGLPDAREKAWRIANGGDPDRIVRGPKVRAFWRALAGDREACVLDMWMFKAFGIDPNLGAKQRAVYDAVEAGIRAAARRHRVPVRDFQATIWLHVRGAKPSDPDYYLAPAPAAS